VKDEHVEEELLQRYFDGGLEGAHAARVEQHLAGCASCSARHRALDKLRQGLRIAAEERARGVDFEALFANVERGVRERPDPGLAERFAVSWRDRLEQRSRQIWIPAAGAVAAAAALLLFLRGSPAHERTISGPDEAIAGERGLAGNPAANSEVEQVDFGANAGTVFEIALPEGISTPVVWINDDGEANEE
jgi:putative zinc finger protein